ncbi:MAG: fabG 1 [Burkholderiaceae bacterium]|nr:fabG 1 [Burkholderiaceae bacterium]
MMSNVYFLMNMTNTDHSANDVWHFDDHLPKVALVTGGAKRIGRELCLALARAGFDVAVHYGRSGDEAVQLVQELLKCKVRACAVQADLSDANAVAGLMSQVTQQLGAVGVLINNASVFEYDVLTQPAPLDLALFEQHWRTNTFAPMVLSQQLCQQLPSDAQGVIINLLDQKLYNPNPDFLSYTLSKSALKEATILSAQAFAPRVRVVGIALGLSLPSGTQSIETFNQVHQQTILQRGSTPRDVAQAMLFAMAARSMTGTVLQVDGGQHLTPSARDVMFKH